MPCIVFAAARRCTTSNAVPRPHERTQATPPHQGGQQSRRKDQNTLRSSTYFSLRESEAGKPWGTRLPFPVHCVERVVSYDYVSKSRITSRFAYHYGCYDSQEREFRGFAAAEKWDTEDFSSSLDGSNDDVVNEDRTAFAPPVDTKMWLHTGVYIGRRELGRELSSGYFNAPDQNDPTFNDFLYTLLADSNLPLPDPILTGPQLREACRALKGSSCERKSTLT
jgi:Insecticide toxin TcdB middle/N-terminal region